MWCATRSELHMRTRTSAANCDVVADWTGADVTGDSHLQGTGLRPTVCLSLCLQRCSRSIKVMHTLLLGGVVWAHLQPSLGGQELLWKRQAKTRPYSGP